MIHKKISVVSFVVMLVSLFILAGCGSSAPAEPAATAVRPTAEPAQPPAETTSQWNPDPAQNIHVTNLGGDQAIPRIVTGDNGDFYVAWFSNPPGRENYDVRMQRYDAQGNVQWEENGRLISDNKSNTWISDYVFTKDNDGNLILAFQDMRDGSSNLYAYKFSPDGEPLWGKDGLRLTDTENLSAPFPSSVVTPDSVTLIWGNVTDDSLKLTLQKLTADGEKLWGDDGLIVPGQETESFIQGAIVPGNDDEIIVVYGIEEESRLQTMSIYAQKLDAEGNSIWNDGKPVLIHDSVPFYILPNVVSDEAGGAYIAWHTTDLKGFVQHLAVDGQPLMPEGGAPLVAPGADLQLAPRMQFAPEKEALFIFWSDADSQQYETGLGGQKMSPTGELLWGDNGRTYVERSRTELSLITPRLTGENIVLFYGHGETTGDGKDMPGVRLKAQLIDENGETVWPQPAILSAAMSSKSKLEVAAIGEREWVAVWSEKGENGRDILMQNLLVSESAQLANPASVFCGEQGGTLELRANDDGGQYGVCVFDDGNECEEWAFYRGECKPGE